MKKIHTIYNKNLKKLQLIQLIINKHPNIWLQNIKITFLKKKNMKKLLFNNLSKLYLKI